MLAVSTPLKFSQKYFCIALARNVYFSIIKERHLYSWKNFCGTLENYENHKSLAQQIFSWLLYYTLQYHWLIIYTVYLISMFNDRWSTPSSGVCRTPFMATPFLLILVTASAMLSWSDEMRPLILISSNSTGTLACLHECMNISSNNVTVHNWNINY